LLTSRTHETAARPLFEQGAREADVLSCVPGPRLNEDGIARHPQFHRPLAIVLSLATWHTVRRADNVHVLQQAGRVVWAGEEGIATDAVIFS
jgi:hypothetical protein